MFPVYLLEDNSIQRQKYAEFIKNGILINDADLELKSHHRNCRRLHSRLHPSKTRTILLRYGNPR